MGIEAIHEQIKSEFSRTFVNYTKIKDAVWNLQLCASDLKDLKENKFSSMNSVNYTIKTLENYISKAENAMKD